VYPTDIKPEKFAELKKRVHQGEKLFRRNCENCHGITKKIKDSVVKLDLSNIVRYHKAFLRGDNKNHAFSQHLSNDELTDILLFIEVVKKD
jgi:mono/diheme cytochrome c family protein